ncbi:MAG TPA: imidazoleglycerol-phosphate dehydratase HisB [Nitrospiria bacterium]|jgi:imidazoleglycerol-phosphate dehydratase|nr:imidazoleglycerol-phosphate dehydratase HisB [Nitrospiria bacterium]
MKTRRAEVQRKTTETQVKVRLDLDGTGRSRVQTTMPFLDHMLTLMAKHGRMDLAVMARGDTEVDFHHTVEDIGIVLGEAVSKALRDKKGIKRYGSFSVPMDEAIARVDLDLSGRPYLIYQVPLPRKNKIRDFDVELIEEFFKAFVVHSGTTLHINVPYGKNPHHVLEAIFKAFGRALDLAVQMDARTRGVPSTKGKL